MFENTFCYSTVQVLLGLREVASSLIGVGLTIQEEELKGEVSTFDLYSFVMSWGHVNGATLSARTKSVNEEWSASQSNMFLQNVLLSSTFIA